MKASFFLMPLAIFFVAFWIIPAGLLLRTSLGPELSLSVYMDIAANPRYWKSMASTLGLALAVTISTLTISTGAGVFLQRWQFPGRAVLKALLTLPLSFPGVVVGFLVILLVGRNGLLTSIGTSLTGKPMVLAYSITGLFLGYLYFSIPRVILTIMASLESIDPLLEESARTMGAGSWRIFLDVIAPALGPAFLASGSICFATAMGAFGTAFTLATEINVVPMLIYDEFTNFANFTTAAALSVVLGALTYTVISLGKRWSNGINVPIA
jgi:putative spermidine/putrescine transport system permease protein